MAGAGEGIICPRATSPRTLVPGRPSWVWHQQVLGGGRSQIILDSNPGLAPPPLGACFLTGCLSQSGIVGSINVIQGEKKMQPRAHSIYKCSGGYYQVEVPHFLPPHLMPEGTRVALGVGDVSYDHVQMCFSVSGHLVSAPAWDSICRGVRVCSQRAWVCTRVHWVCMYVQAYA